MLKLDIKWWHIYIYKQIHMYIHVLHIAHDNIAPLTLHAAFPSGLAASVRCTWERGLGKRVPMIKIGTITPKLCEYCEYCEYVIDCYRLL